MKKINYLLFIICVFVFNYSITFAEMMKHEDVPERAFIIGTHIFSDAYSNSSYYDGIVNSSVVMLGSTSIDLTNINKQGDFIIYYKVFNADSDYPDLYPEEWINSLTGKSIDLADIPDEFYITHKNGVCIDPSCDPTSSFEYTITFSDSDTELKNIKVAPDEIISSYDVPELEDKAGLDFACWYDYDTYGDNFVYSPEKCFNFENTKITKNYNLKAKWLINSYKIKYDLNGGALNTEDATTDLTHIEDILNNGQSCALDFDNNSKLFDCTFLSSDKLVREGYKFIGWSTIKDDEQYFVPGSVMSYFGDSSDVTLYAVWKPVEYDITYELDGGFFDGDLPTNKALFNSIISSVDVIPKKEFSSFAKWYYLDNDNNKVYIEDTGLTVTGDVTLYAEWKASKYDILYYIDDQQVASNTCTYGENCTIYDLSNSFAEDMKLIGWSLVEDGGLFYTADAVSTNFCQYIYTTKDDGTYTCNLYAVYDKYYNVNYDLNGGAWNGTDASSVLKAIAVGETIKIDKVPTKHGLLFSQWESSNVNAILTPGLDKNYSLYLADGVDVTLTAQWINAYNVVLDLNGGEFINGNNSTEVAVGENDYYLLPDNIANNGYTIDHWDVYSVKYAFKSGVTYYDVLRAENGETYSGRDESGSTVTNKVCNNTAGCVYFVVTSDTEYDSTKQYVYPVSDYGLDYVHNDLYTYLDVTEEKIDDNFIDKSYEVGQNLKFVAQWTEIATSNPNTSTG